MKEISGLVLSCTPYGERDAIIKLLEASKIVSVFCKGTQPTSSKNRRLTMPFTKVSLIVNESRSEKSMPRLVKGNIEASYTKITEDLEYSAIAFVLRDSLFHAEIIPDMEECLIKALSGFCQGSRKQGLDYSCFLLKLILETDGIAPYVDGCIKCQKTKGIENLSMSQGGFLCAVHNRGREKMEPAKLKAMRHLFKASYLQSAKLFEAGSYTLQDLIFLARWLEHYMNFEMPSLQFLESIERLDQKN